MARGRKRRAEPDREDRDNSEDGVQRPKRARTSESKKKVDRNEACTGPSPISRNSNQKPGDGKKSSADTAKKKCSVVSANTSKTRHMAKKVKQEPASKSTFTGQHTEEKSVYFQEPDIKPTWEPKKLNTREPGIKSMCEGKQLNTGKHSKRKDNGIGSQRINDNDSEKDFEIIPSQQITKQKQTKKESSGNKSVKDQSKSNKQNKKPKRKQEQASTQSSIGIKSRSKTVDPTKGKANIMHMRHEVQGELMLDLAAEAGIKPLGTTRESDEVQMMSGSDSESDWEEVEELPGSHHGSPVKSQLPKEPVQITLEAPDILKKRKKKRFDMEAWFKRQMNRYQRDMQEDVHKVHLLCLLAIGLQQNSVLTSDAVKAMAISLVPVEFTRWQPRSFDTAKVEKVTKWFRATFKLKGENSNESIQDQHEDRLCQQLGDRMAVAVDYYAQMYVSLLRILGLVVRLVVSLRPVPLKPSKAAQEKEWKNKLKKSKRKETSKTSSECQLNASQKKLAETIDSKVSHASTKYHGKSTADNSSKPVCSTSKKDVKHDQSKRSSQVAHKNSSKKSSSKHVAAKQPSGKKKKKGSVDGKEGSNRASEGRNSQRSRQSSSKVSYKDESEDESEEEEDKGKKREKKSKKEEEAEYDVLDVLSSNDSDSDFEITEITYRSPPSGSQRKKNRKVVSSGSEDSIQIMRVSKATKGTDMWAEVYLWEEEKWICIDCSHGEVNCASEMESRVSKPLMYVLAYDNENSVKDVTRRYANSWQSQTRKLRVDADWWDESLAPYKSTDLVREAVEDEALQAQMLKKPLPTSLAEYKNHPLYALKRHLLKFEAIYPDTSIPVGYFKGEPVYARESVHTLHTRQTWLKEARVVRIGETAYKTAKGRQKWRDKLEGKNEDPQIELFGRWQTEDYIPPPAVDGKVPRNEYGNVELFQPSMLPSGTVHLQINGLNRIAKKLDIDCVPAMVGFDTHCGWSHPVLDGFVVCEEFKDILLAAYDEDQEIQKEKEAQKKEQRALKNWTLLVKGLIIKERLKKRFDLQPAKHTEESCSTSAEPGEKATDVQQSWPRNRKEDKKSKAKGKKKAKSTKEDAGTPFPFEVEQM